MNVAVKAGDSIKWHSDGSVNHGGFNICFDRFSADAPTAEPTKEPTAVPTNEPTAVPTKEPTNPPTTDGFKIVSGNGVEVNGNCFTDGDGNHGSNEDATIEVLKSGWISAVGHFQTEKRYVGRVVRHSARHCVVRHRRSRFPLSLSHPSPLL